MTANENYSSPAKAWSKKQPEHDKPRSRPVNATYILSRESAVRGPETEKAESRSSSQLQYVCTYVRYLYPTFANSRQQKPTEPSMCPNSLQHATVRYDSVLIQDCELSQRESISPRFSMPLDLLILLSKTTRRKLEQCKSMSGPS